MQHTLHIVAPVSSRSRLINVDMGSKTPEGGHHGNYGMRPYRRSRIKKCMLISIGDVSGSANNDQLGGEPRGVHTSQDGDGCLGDGGGDDDDGDGVEVDLAPSAALPSIGANTQKKRRKPRKKKAKKILTTNLPAKQSFPPRVPLSNLFPACDYPQGELQSHPPVDHATARITAGEIFHGQRYWEDEEFLRDYRKAAEVHRQVRQWVQDSVRPGQTIQDIAVGIEDSVRALLGNAGLEPGDSRKAGMGFPTGICLNHQVAHYTPNPGQKEVVLQQQDVMTVDFGVHINGWNVDSAFTMAFDPTYDSLLAAVKDATNTGIKVKLVL